MGGAKCSYRNCTMRSNGVTHMFHYPVFDKLRCHQWLSNAQRQDFLNLKLSQVKNRVVCQHHFKPDDFMNFKMDKLKFDAVPRENGPFCDAPDLETDDDIKVLPIAPDEIDNDNFSCTEKKKNFSVKYGDFLINSEGDQKPKLNELKTINITEEYVPTDLKDERIQFEQISFSKEPTKYIPADLRDDRIQCEQISLPKEPTKKKKIHIISEKKVSTPVAVTGTLKPVPPNSIIKPRNKKDNVENMEVLFRSPTDNIVNTDTTRTNLDIFNNPQTMVDPQNILSEQSSITLPSVDKNFEPNKRNVPVHMHNQITQQQNIVDCSPAFPYLVPLESKNVPKGSSPLKSKNHEINKINNQSPSKSFLKNKIPPERVAAIEEKRQFNKKLRDMIEFCLDDTPKKQINQNNESVDSEKRENVQTSSKIMENENKKAIMNRRVSLQGNLSEKVSSHLSKDYGLPSLNDYNMASLEARLKKMEDNLLMKITQNSKNILDMKKMLQVPPGPRTSVGTQTKDDEDTIKKQLYLEISQFLSPAANSLVYEELFLNTFEPKKNKSRKRKLKQTMFLDNDD